MGALDGALVLERAVVRVARVLSSGRPRHQNAESLGASYALA